MVRPSIPTSVILDAAARVVEERGFAGVRMDAIAERAGVAKGVLYLRFPGKAELLVALLRHEIAQATTRTVELVDADPRGGLLSRLYTHSLAALHERPVLLRFYRDEPAGAATLLAQDDGSRFRSSVLIGAAFIRELQDAGLVDATLDADVFATNLALWSWGLAAQAPHRDVSALIAGMGDLVARAADVDVADSTPGKQIFARLAAALTDQGVPA